MQSVRRYSEEGQAAHDVISAVATRMGVAVLKINIVILQLISDQSSIGKHLNQA